jgi:fructose-bisphosphate aldolase class II/tagatose 1,6-diphosphate aldolase GatY/KbaY
MIDASDKEFTENITLTSNVVKMAEPYHVNVEAELGYVPKPDNEVDLNKFTEPLEAKRFVEETGVTSLAIAVGSKHGFYRGKPVLDVQRIAEIRKITNAFLVLHGASGLPAETLKDAVANGISKVNIATETKHLFMKSLRELLLKSDDIDLRNLFPSAVNKINNMIQHKIEIVSMTD